MCSKKWRLNKSLELSEYRLFQAYHGDGEIDTRINFPVPVICKHFWCKYVVPNKPMGAIVAIYRPFHMHNNKKML